jgi:hypothetical protein
MWRPLGRIEREKTKRKNEKKKSKRKNRKEKIDDRDRSGGGCFEGRIFQSLA